MKLFCQIYGIIVRSIPVVIAQLIGWALFSYVEDDLNIIDCVANRDRVAEMFHPFVNATHETQREIELFTTIAIKTGHIMSENQSIEAYKLFQTYFNVPDTNNFLSNKDKAYLGCLKWYRFSVMTMTTIGEYYSSFHIYSDTT